MPHLAWRCLGRLPPPPLQLQARFMLGHGRHRVVQQPHPYLSSALARLGFYCRGTTDSGGHTGLADVYMRPQSLLCDCVLLGNAGITVVPGVLNPDTNKVELGQPFVHKAFISTIYADAPFRAKLLYLVAGFTALLVCAFCRLTGQRKGPGKGIMRYLGYAGPSRCTQGPGEGQQYQLGVADEQRVYTSKEMQRLAETAQHLCAIGREEEAMQQTASHGLSPLLRCLPYQDVRTVSVVPFMHAYCQGVLKDWLKAFLVSPNKPQPQRRAGMAGSSLPQQQQQRRRRKRQREGQQGDEEEEEPQQQQGGAEGGSQQQPQAAGQGERAAAATAGPSLMLAPGQRAALPMRKVISARCKDFGGGLHPQVNRPVSDLVKHHAGLTMEELANGVRGLFAHLLWPVCANNRAAEVLSDPLVLEAYGCLREFGHFHLTDGTWATWEEFEEAVDAAQAKLLHYGALAEKVRCVASPGVQTAVTTWRLCVLGVRSAAVGSWCQRNRSCV